MTPRFAVRVAALFGIVKDTDITRGMEMNLFGDPRAPRRNLWGGLVLTALGALLVGMTESQLTAPELWPGAHRSEWRNLVLGVLIIVSGVMQFRLGLRAARFPDDAAAGHPDR